MPPDVKDSASGGTSQMVRICESNSLECSGVVPCGKCYKIVTQHVIPGAMRAGGFAGDRTQAGNFLKAYVEGWKKLLEEKVAEKKANLPSAFVTPPDLLEFFAYRDAIKARELLASQLIVVAEPATEAISATTKKNPGSAGKKKGTSLRRGDLKRMVEKQAKEPLANPGSRRDLEKNGSGIHQNQANKDPGIARDEEKH
jgi:hypothetical protein